MRKIERIEPFMDKLKGIWIKNPDLRFWQLINLVVGECCELEKTDPFFWEEDKWLELIDQKFNSKK